jgi:hypothetical protein
VRLGEKAAPVAAVVSALSCMACCLPFGIAAAAGMAGAAVALDGLRPYLMTASVVLLGFGLWQLYRQPRVCRSRSKASVAIFWSCAALVLALILAPQLVAGWLADL